MNSGEWMTLLGAVCCILSPSFTWKFDPPRTKDMVGAIYVQQYTGNAFYKTGFDIGVGWAVVLGGAICGLLLVLAPSAREARLYMAVQIAIGLAALVLAAAHLAAYAGIVLAIAGAALLIAGAVAQYGRAVPARAR